MALIVAQYVTPENPIRSRVAHTRGTAIGSGYASYSDFATALGLPSTVEREIVVAGAKSLVLA